MRRIEIARGTSRSISNLLTSRDLSICDAEFNSIQFNFIRKIQVVTMYDKSVKKGIYLHSTRPK